MDWLIGERPGKGKNASAPEQGGYHHRIHEGQHSRQSGTSVPHHQAAVRLSESHIQGAAEKRYPTSDFFHSGQPISGGPDDSSMGEISLKPGITPEMAINGLNRLALDVCERKIVADMRHFNR